MPPIRKWPNDSITLPAASGPVWPSSSTTRVEATFSDSRSSVVISSTVGKAAKSSGFTMYAAISSTISAIAMLKVNSRSSAKGGSGSTIIARIMTMSSGAGHLPQPRPCDLGGLRFSHLRYAGTAPDSGSSSAGTGKADGSVGRSPSPASKRRSW